MYCVINFFSSFFDDCAKLDETEPMIEIYNLHHVLHVFHLMKNFFYFLFLSLTILCETKIHSNTDLLINQCQMLIHLWHTEKFEITFHEKKKKKTRSSVNLNSERHLYRCPYMKSKEYQSMLTV